MVSHISISPRPKPCLCQYHCHPARQNLRGLAISVDRCQKSCIAPWVMPLQIDGWPPVTSVKCWSIWNFAFLEMDILLRISGKSYGQQLDKSNPKSSPVTFIINLMLVASAFSAPENCHRHESHQAAKRGSLRQSQASKDPIFQDVHRLTQRHCLYHQQPEAWHWVIHCQSKAVHWLKELGSKDHETPTNINFPGAHIINDHCQR